jgi:hypothetical protein
MGRNRVIAVAVAVLCALAVVTLAARSDRAPTLTPTAPTALPTVVLLPGGQPVPDGGAPPPGQDDGTTRLPGWLLWAFAALVVAPVVLAAVFLAQLLSGPALRRRWRLPGRTPRDAAVDPHDDEVAARALSGAVEEGLRELDQGGPGEGVLASWVLLERAAADAGTHRAAPDTPAELAGKLIDRHAVSSGPLLRLAELYREARFSTHDLPESARAEARAALEQLRTELAAHPVGGPR